MNPPVKAVTRPYVGIFPPADYGRSPTSECGDEHVEQVVAAMALPPA
jgi:hypothetical protein